MEQSYKEKYEQALERIKNLIDKDHNDINVDDILNVFPELAESEDEKVRKGLIDFVNQYGDKFYGQITKEYVIAWLGKQGEQKPEENKGNLVGISPNSEWSEEDDSRYSSCLYMLERETSLYNWLKSLKGRVGCEANCTTTKEWSEEDERMIKEIISDVKFEGYNNDMQADSYKKINWLKSLRPQNHWKPSDEQMGCLSDAIEHYNSLGYPASKLKELLDDLKILKEGKV